MRDGASAALYGLPFLVAPHCEDGTIAVMWTDLVPDVDPTHFFVQDGVAYVGRRNGLPVPAVDGDVDAYVWRLGTDAPTVEAAARFGIAEPETFVRRAERSGQAALARHLLARSVVRGLRGLNLDDDRLQHAARLGAEVVLNLIEAGGDPLVVKNSPGWQLQEVSAGERYAALPPRPSGRAIMGIVESLDEVALESLDAGPKRLVEGETITVLTPLALVARGPMIYETDDAGRRYGTNHRLTVDVPPGSQLELTKVYDMGHADASTGCVESRRRRSRGPRSTRSDGYGPRTRVACSSAVGEPPGPMGLPWLHRAVVGGRARSSAPPSLQDGPMPTRPATGFASAGPMKGVRSQRFRLARTS